MHAADGIRRLLAVKAEALVARSADALEAILDPLFLYVNAGGGRFDKRSYIDAYCVSGRVIFKVQAFEDLDVRDFGGFAVGTMTVRDQFEYGGKLVAGEYRSLCVFRKAETGWLWSAGQTASKG
jgi:hypothetical protein